MPQLESVEFKVQLKPTPKMKLIILLLVLIIAMADALPQDYDFVSFKTCLGFDQLSFLSFLIFLRDISVRDLVRTPQS